jgi:alpha-amylase
MNIKTIGRVLCISIIMSLMGVVGQAQTQALPWWSTTTWYLLFVRSFYDSNGDGIGDLRGVIEKLDYLNDGDPNTTTDLGVTGIWLMPIFSAQSYHGYDTLDYYAIEPDYGTMEDFEELLVQARQRGIRIILDMVMNHTSSQHEWFQKAASGDPEYNDWFVWETEKPNTLGPWGQPAWYANGERFYYAPFWSEMPDLNYDNPAVRARMLDIAGYWLDKGIDGYRLDAIKYVVEEEVDGRNILSNSPANLAWLKEYNDFVKSINPEAVTIGEIWDPTLSVLNYVEQGSVDMAFEFDYAEAMISGVRSANNRSLRMKLASIVRDYPVGTFATFLSNHDLPRVMTQVQNSIGQDRTAAAILLLSPGAPFIYYGEEIGMSGDKPDENIRTPMQWDNTNTRGFTTSASPWNPYTPDNTFNVAEQAIDPTSLWSLYRDLIAVRNNISAFRSGNTEVAEGVGSKVFSMLRYDENGRYLVFINLDDAPLSNYNIRLDTVFDSVNTPEIVYGSGEITPITLNAENKIDGYKPKEELAPFEVLIIRI